MKKLLLTFLLAIAAMTTFSQTINYGIKGGFNLSDQSTGSFPYIIKHQKAPGFNIGGIASADFGNFTLQPALSLTTKGVKYPDQSHVLFAGTPNPITQTMPAATVTAYDIELSANAFYNIHVAPGAVIQLGGGPSFGYNISARANVDNPAPNTPSKFALGYNNPELGVNFIAGVKLKKKLLIDIGYNLGLSNLVDNGTIKNRVMNISVGYLFW
ncbi:outer membrane beta-barrel protein [Mucilaginibacter sp. McL0603]|uniref:outer membrane beta-barrel protein n=1 Tax=Mucilaginibacter sp. McL0603 TaxID=3415670 RepID=UPI003CF317D2